MLSLCYRRATIADVPLLAALNQQLQADEEHRLRMELSDLEPRMAQWLGDGGYEAIVIECAGETAGYALYRSEESGYYLKQFFVCRHLRRQGIGRQAMDWLAENIWQDAPAVCLDVLVHNSAGIAFWKAAGFADYCITMERRIAQTA